MILKTTKRMWNLRSIKVIAVVVWALGSTSNKLKNCTEELWIVISTALLQKIALLGTARMLIKVCENGGGGGKGFQKLNRWERM